MMADYQNYLKSLVETASTLVEEYNNRVKSGELTLDDAQDRALKRLSVLRYSNGEGYFWVHTAGERPVMLMHPIKPEMKGKDLAVEEDFSIVQSLFYEGQVYAKNSETIQKNVKATRLFVEMNRVCAERGEGYVKYYWPKPGEDQTVGYPKLSYVKLFKPWNWVIGTGIYIDEVEREVAKIRQETGAKVRQTILVVFLSLSGSLVIALFLALFFSRSISRPINQMVDAAGRLAQGDLTAAVAVYTPDEIGLLASSFEQMRQQLRNLIQSIAQASTQVSSTADVLAAQMEQTSNAATETAATVSEIAATVDSVALNIKEVSGELAEANRQATQGQQNIRNVVETMQEIDNAAGRVAASVSALSQAIEKIGQFVGTINDIAEQTNLLALNAAIEAARAGEAGRGFAVVAEEVRKLAENSARSAREVSAIVNEVQQQSIQAVKDMESGRESAARGDKVVQEVSQSLMAIIELVQDLSQKAQNVAGAAGQMAEAVQNMAASVEEQTAAVEETSASATELKKVAGQLKELVDRFRIA